MKTYIAWLNNPRRIKALESAMRRGDAATEWLKTNKLTKETQAEFNAIMKKVS